MIKKISPAAAVKIMIVVLSLVLVYHLLILTGLIPYDLAWGGQLTNKTEMIRFESVSIIFISLILLVVLIKGAILKVKISTKLITIAFWIFTFLFSVNTFANLFSINVWEAIIFTPITLLLAVLSLRLALDKTDR